jgi:hypothetical protein
MTRRSEWFAAGCAAVAVALLTLPGCGRKVAEKRMSDADLAAQTMNSPDTGTVVTAYFNCLKAVAPRTPNGHSALDLERLEAVTQACNGEEHAMTTRVADTWGKTDEPATAASRLRGLQDEARKIIRDNPYVPPSVTISGRG